MERTTFRIALHPAAPSDTGVDAIAFLVSPNVGEEPRPLASVASGGEISRIALALKTCLAQPARAAGARRTLVFDEVDTGIGGSAAEGVGRRLKKLAEANQVLCVTHLPQIALRRSSLRRRKHERAAERLPASKSSKALRFAREIGRMLCRVRCSPPKR